ncbi:MAG: biotin--[acetyl-CoA-carboxylase] ligase, partial [Halobacteriovoraceae bacterium]|nr:biotin--[acetyl-CoA-carboxylase] ligase [Halobacteriovoraceae bacterium]
MILHRHFARLFSTQNHLKDNLESLTVRTSNVLISTDLQTNGIGRRNRNWHHKKNALALSFTLPYSKEKNLVSLEMAVILAEFLKKKTGSAIGLKWPNDLINEKGQKCGGIIIHLQKEIFIVGVGINWGKCRFNEEYDYLPGVVDESYGFKKEDYKKLPYLVYDYVLNHRSNSQKEAREQWMNLCVHMDGEVKIREN